MLFYSENQQQYLYCSEFIPSDWFCFNFPRFIYYLLWLYIFLKLLWLSFTKLAVWGVGADQLQKRQFCPHIKQKPEKCNFMIFLVCVTRMICNLQVKKTEVFRTGDELNLRSICNTLTIMSFKYISFEATLKLVVKYFVLKCVSETQTNPKKYYCSRRPGFENWRKTPFTVV